MKTFVLIVCISVQILLISAKIWPKNVPTFCPRSEPNYNKCMENTLKKMGPQFLKGIRAINFPKLHPLTIPSFSVDRNLSENVLVQMTFKNIVANGYDKMELRKFDFDPNELKGKIVLNSPLMEFKTEYDAHGRILNFNITSNGFGSVTSPELDLEFDLKLKRINKIGVDYLTIDKMDFKALVQDTQLKLTAEDPAFQKTVDLIATTFNQNSKEILRLVQPIYEESLDVIYRAFLDRFFSSVPADEIIPE